MSGKKRNRRQSDILAAFSDLGGQATTRQIAEKTGFNVNGVSQTLGAMYKDVECVGGRAGETVWKLIVPDPLTDDFLEDDEYEIVQDLLPKILNTPMVLDVRPEEGIERVHDDHEGTFKGRLQIQMSRDGDLWIKTTPTHSGSGFLRFRAIGGGSASPRIHNALRLLMLAMKLDNAAHPVAYPDPNKPKTE